ncbi:MAG: glycosyltransferase [Oscillospiraceae bacterium]
MISVVMACYNGEKYILEQMDSINSQTLLPDEVVICDDCSTDNTAQIVRNFIEEKGLSNWHFSVNPKNIGYCLNFYGGIMRAKGDVIFLSDQDDIWLPEKLRKMSVAMEDESISALSSRYVVVNGRGEEIDSGNIPYMGTVFDNSIEEISIDSQIGCSWVRGFSMCFRSNLKQYMKPLDFKSLLSHDWYISMLAALSGRSCFLNTVLTKYRYHESNVSLSAMNRKELKGTNIEKRIRGLAESVNGHKELICESYKNLSADNRRDIERFIDFEQKRMTFLKSGNFFRWVALALKLTDYKRYYKSLFGGVRVWTGDFIYRYF